MGYLQDSVDSEVINLTNPTYWVKVKTCVSRSEQRRIEAELMTVTYQQGGGISGQPNIIKSRDLLVAFSVLEWNLTDNDGAALPVNPATVSETLTGRDFDLIWKRLDQLNRMPTEEETAKFPGAGGGSDQGAGERGAA